MRMRAMKRYLIPILIPLVLVSVLLLGCNGISSSEPKASDYQQRIAELEQQVAALTKQGQELSNENRLEPKVIEKDVEAPSDYQLPLQLKVGDRVEGEVSITPGEGAYILFGKVKDPYGNILVETPRIDIVYIGGMERVERRVVDSPWRFAFIAATDGEYKLGVTYRYSAHLKIIHYTGN